MRVAVVTTAVGKQMLLVWHADVEAVDGCSLCLSSGGGRLECIFDWTFSGVFCRGDRPSLLIRTRRAQPLVAAASLFATSFSRSKHAQTRAGEDKESPPLVCSLVRLPDIRRVFCCCVPNNTINLPAQPAGREKKQLSLFCLSLLSLSLSLSVCVCLSHRDTIGASESSVAVFWSVVVADTFERLSYAYNQPTIQPHQPTQQPSRINLLLRAHLLEGPGSSLGARALAMVELTLKAMAKGGIYDHLFDGFARFFVDLPVLFFLSAACFLARDFSHVYQACVAFECEP